MYRGRSEGMNFIIREIEETDLLNGFFETLSNLSDVKKISQDKEKTRKVINEIKSNSFYKLFVAVSDESEIIGSTTLLIEQKFIHDGGKVGHIEDVVTRKGYEGFGIGSSLINRSLQFAKQIGCYKVILECSIQNVPFYTKLGFKQHEVSMRYNVM
jgi:glucosamine-phosphate N-acetyltransferase